MKTRRPVRHGRQYRKFRDQHRIKCQAMNAPCWICRQPINYQAHHSQPDAYQLDHYHPVSTHPHLIYDPTNARPSHAKCNGQRGATAPTRTEWIPANW